MPTKKEQLANDAKLVTDTYWEWHLAFRQGMTPPIEYLPLSKIVQRVLGSRATPDEVLAALKDLRPGEVPTIEGLTRGVYAQRDNTRPNPYEIVEAFQALMERHRGHRWTRDAETDLVGMVDLGLRWGRTRDTMLACLLIWAARRPADPIKNVKSLLYEIMWTEQHVVDNLGLNDNQLAFRAFHWRTLAAS